MKHHYVIFLLMPVLLYFAMLMPMLSYEIMGIPQTENAFSDFADESEPYLFLAPTAIATVLLLIKNYTTALIGSIIYTLLILYSVIRIYIIIDRHGENVEVGIILILTVFIIATSYAFKQTKLLKALPKRPVTGDTLDNEMRS